MKIAFLGMGQMGRRMAHRLMEAGYEVAVWNRTSIELEGFPKLAPNAKSAVHGADVVFSMVRDDVASQEIWVGERGVFSTMKKGAIAVECSTCSVSHIRWLRDSAKEAGVPFLAAPLAGSTPQADAGKLIFFIGGENHLNKKLDPLFAVMGQSHFYFEDVSEAMGLKLWVNGLFAAQISIFSELLSMGKHLGLDFESMSEGLRQTPVCSLGLSMASQAMLAQQFKAGFPLDLVAKDLRLIVNEAQIPLELPQIKQVLRVYEQAVEQGRGSLHITGVVLNHLPELAVSD